jgi:hypothetical protein
LKPKCKTYERNRKQKKKKKKRRKKYTNGQGANKSAQAGNQPTARLDSLPNR